MIEYYKTDADGTRKIAAPEPGCWIRVVAPNASQKAWLENESGILPEFVRSALDEEESPHIDYDDETDQTLVIVDCPAIEDENDVEDPSITQYDTQPVSVIFLPQTDMIVTVSLKEGLAVDDFASGKIRQVDTRLRTRFLLQLLLHISQQFLMYLRNINRQFARTEKQLRASLKNSELIKMLGLEKSLVYFSTSLKADEATLARIMSGRAIKLHEADQDLCDDVIIEIRQAIEMCDIYSNILNGTMEAFGNVISNNLNIVMRTLTVITIVMAIPTIVFSFYGMNVSDLPEAGSWLFPTLLSLAGCAVAVVFFARKNMLK